MSQSMRLTRLNQLWEEHRAQRFPAHLGGVDIDGIDFVLLDADIAGCVHTFLQRGHLDIGRVAVLGRCYRNAQYVIQRLAKNEVAYFMRLEALAEMLLCEVIRLHRLPDE